MVIYFRLVKAGYGSLKEVKKMNSREVLQALNYEKFVNNYEDCYLELNKDESS